MPNRLATDFVRPEREGTSVPRPIRWVAISIMVTVLDVIGIWMSLQPDVLALLGDAEKTLLAVLLVVMMATLADVWRFAIGTLMHRKRKR